MSGCDLGVVHLGMKTLGVALFFFAFYRYGDFLQLDRRESVVAAVLLGVSSGLGGLLALLGWRSSPSFVPADLWLVDSNTYWSLLWNPLFPWSLTLLLLTIFLLDRGTRDGRKSDAWFAGLAAGVLALLHPYSQPLLLTFAAVMAIRRQGIKAWGYLCRFLAALLPFAAYVVLVSQFNPLLSRHATTGEMRSPFITAYLLGFGLPLLLAAGGLAAGGKPWLERRGQILLWFLLSLGFSYLPFWFQRKLILGAHIPLCILAATSVVMIWSKWTRPPWGRWSAVGAAVILLPLLVTTPFYLLVHQSREVRANADGCYFIRNEIRQALAFLKDHSKPDDIVFATPETSRLIPPFSGNTVLWGHWAQSVDGDERAAWFANLGALDEERRTAAFWGAGIKYIFAAGPFKQTLEQNPSGWEAILKVSEKVFDNESVAIYQYRGR